MRPTCLVRDLSETGMPLRRPTCLGIPFGIQTHLFKYTYLVLQVNDTKYEDRVIYIDSIDSLYTNITE